MLLLAVFLTYRLLSPLPGVLYLRRMQKQLESGVSIIARKDWRKGVWKRRMLSLVPWVLGIALVIGIGGRWLNDFEDTPVEDYTGEKPFVSIPEMAQGGEYRLSDFMDYGGYHQWSDILAPVNFEWNEFGSFTTPEGDSYSGFIRIEYHEAASQAVAEALAKDYLKYAENTGYHYSRLEAPESTLDFVAMYQDISRTVIIRQGNIIVRTQLGIDNSETREIPVELWIDLMEEMLVKGGS